MNWDDLRIVIAVCEEGSFARAAARLRIDETTVARRLSRLERSLGTKLFDAVDGTRRPTPLCAAVLEHAHHMSRHVSAIASLSQSRPGVTGRIRLATTPSVADDVLAPRAEALLRHNPGLTLQILASAQNVNFSRWEADLAVRLGRPAKGDFMITRLGTMRLFYFEPEDQGRGPAGRVVCRYPAELDETPESRFLARRGVNGDARFVTESLASIRQLIQSHAACGILPGYACASLLRDPGLRATELPQQRDVWLLVQTHLKRDPAARLVVDWIRKAFRETDMVGAPA